MLFLFTIENHECRESRKIQKMDQENWFLGFSILFGKGLGMVSCRLFHCEIALLKMSYSI